MLVRHVSYSNLAPYDFKGLKIKELTPDDLTSASVAEVEINPGVKHKMARSLKSDKIYICIEGEIAFHVESEYIRMEPGDLLFIQRDEWFSYQNDKDNISRVILVHVPPFDLESEQFRDTKASGGLT